MVGGAGDLLPRQSASVSPKERRGRMTPAKETTPKREQDHFSTVYIKEDLKGLSVRGGMTTVFSQACKFLLNLGSTVVLARILMPEDFGLVAMVTAFIGFLSLFKDMGLPEATVQKENIQSGQINSLFWLNVAISVFLVGLTVALSPLIAWLYGDSRLLAITMGLGVGFLFDGLSAQHQALLRRQMRFGLIAGVTIASQVIGIGTAIYIAIVEKSYWALVVGPVTASFIGMLGFWIFCSWKPGRLSFRADMRAMVRFGSYLTASNMVVYASRNVDDVLLGKFVGATELGFYSRAYRLLMTPISELNYPISAVVIPALSRLQDDPARYRAYFLRAMGTTVLFGIPSVFFSFVCADLVIAIVLGDKWLEAVPIFRVLAPAALFGTLSAAGAWVFIPLGRTDRRFKAVLGYGILVVASFVIGLRWGTMGVAAAYSISYCVLSFPFLAYAFHGTPLSLFDLSTVVWRPFLASVFAGILTVGFRWLELSSHSELLELVLSMLVFSACYLACWLLLPGGKAFLRQTLELLRELKK
jgi:O-antigen/teichoic acid export membrane protein